MAAKLIQVSDDAGATWFTLPGGTGNMSRNGAEIDDTIFGQSFQSNQAGLIDLSISANALYKGFAGYVATIKQQGTPTAFTAEATTLVSGLNYKITDTAKNIWDRNDGVNALDILDNAVSVAAVDILNIDFLFGEVTFVPGYTVVGPITVTGTYLPMITLGRGNSFTLTQTANAIDDSDFATVQANGGYVTREPGLRQVSLTMDGIYDAANGMIALLEARTIFIIEINPDGSDLSVCRGFFIPTSDDLSGNVGALEEESVGFSLNVVETGITGLVSAIPLRWVHDAATTLSTAVQKVLTAWQDETKLEVRYLTDGVNGWKFTSVITDVSLSTGLAAMNEFAANFAADGAATAQP